MAKKVKKETEENVIETKPEIKKEKIVKVIKKECQPDGKKNLDIDALNKARSRMFELQQINRDALIAIIKKLEKW